MAEIAVASGATIGAAIPANACRIFLRQRHRSATLAEQIPIGAGQIAAGADGAENEIGRSEVVTHASCRIRRSVYYFRIYRYVKLKLKREDYYLIY